MESLFYNIPIKLKTFFWEKNQTNDFWQKNNIYADVSSFGNSDKKKRQNYGFTFLKKIITSSKKTYSPPPGDLELFSRNSIFIFWKTDSTSKTIFLPAIKLLIGQNFFRLIRKPNVLFSYNQKRIHLADKVENCQQTFSFFCIKDDSVFFNSKEKKILTFLRLLLKKVQIKI